MPHRGLRHTGMRRGPKAVENVLRKKEENRARKAALRAENLAARRTANRAQRAKDRAAGIKRGEGRRSGDPSGTIFGPPNQPQNSQRRSGGPGVIFGPPRNRGRRSGGVTGGPRGFDAAGRTNVQRKARAFGPTDKRASEGRRGRKQITPSAPSALDDRGADDRDERRRSRG